MHMMSQINAQHIIIIVAVIMINIKMINDTTKISIYRL